MVESLNKRIKLSKRVQRTFVERGINAFSGMVKTASSLGVSVKTVSDWKRSKFSLSVATAKRLSKRIGCAVPNGKIVGRYDHVKTAGRKGGKTVLKRYGRIGGNPKKRMRLWLQWWKKEGQFKKNPILKRKLVTFPKRNDKFAEFVGIMLGDGSITKYQLTITLNSITDKEYAKYVIQLIRQLFHIEPSVRYDTKNTTMVIYLSRRTLTEWLVSRAGLVQGNKIRQKINIPRWIFQSPVYLRVCIRGLIDTDGSVVIHRYAIRGKTYAYKKINFTSASVPLLNSVFNALKDLKLKPRLDKNHSQLLIESAATVKRYMELIGTSNPKHLKRYNS